MLGRRGLAVELFERGRFPREKPCGEGLMPAGVAALDRLGLIPLPHGEVLVAGLAERDALRGSAYAALMCAHWTPHEGKPNS